MSKQTALKWFIEQLGLDCTTDYKEEIEQALQMEHEQMIDAHVHGHNAPSSTIKIYDAEQYYNETYGGK
jgi:uncharacterized protein YbbK (DUF523 family)